MGGFAGLFLKRGTDRLSSNIIFKIKEMYIGAVLYAGAAVLNIMILQYLDYSVVMPMMSITYIWTVIISKFFLKEKITKRKITGLALIITGVFIIATFN